MTLLSSSGLTKTLALVGPGSVAGTTKIKQNGGT
jgi:hypothetical protein